MIDNAFDVGATAHIFWHKLFSCIDYHCSSSRFNSNNITSHFLSFQDSRPFVGLCASRVCAVQEIRCSKLTHLLKDSLGGNCKTAMIFTLSPSAICFEETCSTLRFADRARNITNNPVINVQEDLAWVLERKDKEISRLRQLVALLSEKKNSFLESEGAQDKVLLNDVVPKLS